MSYIATTLDNLIHQTAFFNLTGGNIIMIAVACLFLYLAIAKGFEPLLLTPIAFGMLLVNIYPDIIAPIGADGTAGGRHRRRNAGNLGQGCKYCDSLHGRRVLSAGRRRF